MLTTVPFDQYSSSQESADFRMNFFSMSMTEFPEVDLEKRPEAADRGEQIYIYIYIDIGPRRSSDDTPNPTSWKQPHPRLCFISAGPIELQVLTESTPSPFPVCRQFLGRWDKSGIVHHERHVHVETIPFVVPEDLILFTCPAQLLLRHRLPPCWQRQQPLYPWPSSWDTCPPTIHQLLPCTSSDIITSIIESPSRHAYTISVRACMTYSFFMTIYHGRDTCFASCFVTLL
ncbi:uncharacterized protein B0T23DRAFT_159642 [Neurospora hispaniola]|uniref:Uncharacterized protein n=1 Tax=Neurospora hispaniola TaxID=588809 RepID=A0AAJ0I585_9PEZI|nr:hypothetical protein B0T23DRAFT_159642 [Neurospora hispaniola]